MPRARKGPCSSMKSVEARQFVSNTPLRDSARARTDPPATANHTRREGIQKSGIPVLDTALAKPPGLERARETFTIEHRLQLL